MSLRSGAQHTCCFCPAQFALLRSLTYCRPLTALPLLQAWISAIVAAGTCLISIFVGIPLLKRKVQRDLDAQEQR